MRFRKLKTLILGSLFMMMSPVEATEMLTININASHYMHFDKPIVRVATGSAEIISVVEVGDTKDDILVVAKKPGATSMFVWTADGQRREYVINVSPEDKGLAHVIEEAIALPNVHVKMVKNRILLSGTVKNQYEREYAIKTAQLYVGSGDVNSISNSRSVGVNTTETNSNSISNEVQEFESSGNTGNIIDLLQLENPTQIQFEAQIIEIREDDAKNLGIEHSGSYGHTESGGTSHSGGPSFRNNPYKWFFTHRDSIDFTLHALIEKGKARVLSRPYITTMSGEAASIHIGGEIPIQVVDDGSVGVIYKDYGIILNIVSTVDARNKITSSVTAIVSDVDTSYSTSNGVGLSTREATAVVSLDSGETMVIGGLINSEDSKSISKIPLLGDIPIIGEFFKHTTKSKERRELIILITPTLINNNTPAKMSNDMENLYDEGRQDKSDLNDVDLNAGPPPRSLN